MKKEEFDMSDDLKFFSEDLFQLLPMNHIKKIFKRFESFDGETPKTLLAQMNSQTLELKELSEEEQTVLQNNFLKAVCSPDFALAMKTGIADNIKFLETILAKDVRSSHLLKLIDEADKKIKFASISLFWSHLQLEKNFILYCKSINLLEKVKTTRKEKRANHLAELIREISEPLYKNYLETVWRLSYLAESKMFPLKAPDFGELVNQSENRLKDFPNLVSNEMRLFRNSFTHKYFDYNLEDDSFVVWDRKIPKMKKTADEIVKVVSEVTFLCVETFPLVAQYYLMRNLFLNSGLLDAYLQKMPALTSENPLEVSKANKELSDIGQSLFEPMKDFFQRHQ
jgi:hypothetical protein